MNRTSTPSARGRFRAVSATRRTSSGPMRPVFILPARMSPPRLPSSRRPASAAHPELPATEPRRRGAVPDPPALAGLPLPAVRRSPQGPFLATADGVARPPELGRDARVVRVPIHRREPALLAPPADLAPELEVHPMVVDRPGRVRRLKTPASVV